MTSPFPSGSTSPDTTPWSSSAILPDSANFFSEEGTHSPSEGGGAAAWGEGKAGAGGKTAVCAPAAPAGVGIAGGETGGGTGVGGGEVLTAVFTPKIFSEMSEARSPSRGMISSNVAAATKKAPAVCPVERSDTVTSMLFPAPSFATVPFSKRGRPPFFATSSADFSPGGSRRTSAPASAIRREERRRGRMSTVCRISSEGPRTANGAIAIRRGYSAAQATEETAGRPANRRNNKGHVAFLLRPHPISG